MSDISAKVLEKIKSEHILPKPRWLVVFQRIFVWMVGVSALVVGGLSMSVVIFMVVNSEWDMARQLAGGRIWFILLTLPYAWLFLLGVFLLLADRQIRQTPHGYKIATWWLIGGSIGLSVALGLIFYYIGTGQRIDDTFTRHVPYYTEVGNRRARLIQQPERGVVGGVVLDVSKDELSLRALDAQVWRVYTEDANLIGDIDLVIGLPVLVIGKNIGDYVIEAKIIKEMRPGHGQPRYAPEEHERMRYDLRNR